MCDADTLLLAYFRAEYQIAPYQAKALLALYNARRALSTVELSSVSGVPIASLKPALWALRRALGDEWLTPSALTCMAGRDRQIVYLVTPTGRAGIDTALNAALDGLLVRREMGRRAA
jgi:hypothetical protein